MKKIGFVLVLLALACGLVLAQQTPPAPAGQQAPAAQPGIKLPASPPGVSSTQVSGKWVEPKPGAEPRYTGGKWVVIEYGRPSLKGRTNIFGTGAEYGKKVNADAPVWRAGANVTTRLRTEVPLVFAGKTIEPGDYSVFVDLKPAAVAPAPKAKSNVATKPAYTWTLILSKQPYQQKYDPNNKTETWGSYNYDPQFDVLRAPMKLSQTPDSVEQFTIGFVNVTDTGGTIEMAWEKTKASVAFKVGS